MGTVLYAVLFGAALLVALYLANVRSRAKLRDEFAIQILVARSRQVGRGGRTAGIASADVIAAYDFADIMLEMRDHGPDEINAARKTLLGKGNPPAHGLVSDPPEQLPDLVITEKEPPEPIIVGQP